jgi:tetratricopeptide (TPR) repeat protein
MSRILLVCMSSAFLAVTAQTVGSPQEDVAGRRERQREEMRSFVLQLQSFDREESRDPEVQLGLAILHKKYGRYNMSFRQKSKARFNSVLALDPDNKIARAILAEDASSFAISQGRLAISQLERQIENARQRGAKEICIFTPSAIDASALDAVPKVVLRSPLGEVLGDGTGKQIIVDERDYAQVRVELRQRVDDKLMEAIGTVVQAEERDPQNALYNYLKANLYFELRQPVAAVKALEVAVRKPSARTYYGEKQKAVTKALAAVGAASTLRSYRESFSQIGDYVHVQIWERHVVPLARKSEQEGDLAQARQIYELSIGMAKHIREEPLPHSSEYNRRAGRALDAWAREGLAGLGVTHER